MRQFLVYDLPTRLFHWLFAALFVTAFTIAKTIDDDSPTYSYHMLTGIMLSFIVVMRFIWGFIGSKYSLFSSFSLKPAELILYFKGFLSGNTKKWAGHNPASSWAALIMMVFALGLGLTGYLMTSGPNKEDFEDIHEILANGFVIVAILHVAGIILHTIRHKEMIGLSMIDGKKSGLNNGDIIQSPNKGAATIFLLLISAFGFYLFNNYNSQSRSLNLFGTTLQLGENEEGEEGKGGEEENEEADQNSLQENIENSTQDKENELDDED